MLCVDLGPMSTEDAVHQIQGIVQSAVNDVEVLYGTRMQSFAPVCAMIVSPSE